MFLAETPSPRVPKTLSKNLVLRANEKITAPKDAQSNSQFFRTSKNNGIWSHISAVAESSQFFNALCWSHAFTYLCPSSVHHETRQLAGAAAAKHAVEMRSMPATELAEVTIPCL